MAENQTHDNAADDEHDPGASTQMFRAFVTEGKAEATEEPKLNGRWLAIIGALVLLIAIIAALRLF